MTPCTSLLEGKLEVVKNAGGGDDEASLAVLRDGDLAGEMSFVDGEAAYRRFTGLCVTAHVMSLEAE